RWVTGYNWGSSLNLAELNGELDLAVRIHFLFFKHTFRQKLFSWTGPHQSFPLVSGGSTISAPTPATGGAGTIASIGAASDFGTISDNIAYTGIPVITDNPVNVGSVPAQFDCQGPIK